MIKYYIILFVLLVTNITIKAQTPDLVNFQGIARDASGNILPNKNISVRLSIINDNTSGNLLYSETRNITTNILGYFNIIIGGSGATSTSGFFSDIDWSSENKFLKTEIDPNGGSSFINLGITQLISVPYALNSKIANGLSPNAKINLSNISQNGALAGQVIKWDGTNWVAAQDLQSTTGSNLTAGTGLFIDNNNVIYNIGDGDSSSTNELQTLTLTGTTLSLSNGNSITLPIGATYIAGSGISISGDTINIIGDIDNSATNEIQTISKSGNIVTLSNGGGSFTDADTDAQSLTLSGATLSISNGNSVTLPTGTTYITGPGISISGDTISLSGNIDNSSTNEIQTISKAGDVITLSNGGGSISDRDSQSLSLSGATLSISGGNSVTLPTGTTYSAGPGIFISGSTIAASDNSATNEIQSLSLSGATLSISSGNSVTLPIGTTYTAGSGISISGDTINIIGDIDNSATNEIQSLSLSGATLTISGGNSVTLPTGTTYTAGSGISISGNTIAATDNSTTNEIQTISKTGSTITLSNGGGSISDRDSQTLSISGTTLSISGGNNVTLPTGTTYSAGSGISISGNTIAANDNSATNEIQTISKAGSTITLSNGGGSISDRDSQTLSISGTTLSISGGNNVTLPTGTTYSAGSGISISGNTIAATDNSATNEIQTISKAGSTITLSNGGGSISDRDSQTLSISGTTLSISGGNNVTLPTGTTYSAGSGISISGNTIAANDNSATNEIQTISKAGSTITLSNGGGSISDRDSQTLSISGTTLSISGGNNVTLPTGTTYSAGSGISISGNTIAANDNSATNEIQTISKAGSTITLSNGGGSISDRDSQTLSISGTTLSISGGNNVTLPTGTTYSAGSGISISGNTIAANDNSATNEIQTISKAGSTITLSNGGGSISDRDSQTLSISGTTLSISGGNNVTLPTGTTYSAGSGISISGNTIAATDNSATNEIQTISKAGSTITLSNGGGSISDRDSQTLSISGTTLSISGGNNITLPTGTTYSAGSGISISGSTITNNGDTDASNDITTSTTAGGDLSGTYPNPNVVKIQNRTVSSTAPTNGQVLQWNQTTSSWEPTTISGGASLWTANGNDIYNNNTQNVGIGINPPLAKLHISSNSNNTTEGLLIEETENDTNRVGFKNTNGDGWMLKAYTGSTATNSSFSVFSVKGGGNILRMSGDGNSYFSGAVFTSCGMPSCSDIRYKKDIYKINNSLSNLMKIRGVNYYFKYNDFKDKNFSKEKQIGFIAQEIETIFPELVFTDEDGYKSVDYAKITPVLVEAIKELKNEIDGLRNENNSLKAEINDRLLNLEKVILLQNSFSKTEK